MLVVKVGGGLQGDWEEAYRRLAAEAAALWREGERLVLVHGCSREADSLTRRLGMEPLQVTSASGMPSRYTPPPHLQAFLMAAAWVNARLVALLQAEGAPALGLIPHGGRLLQARRQALLVVREGGRRRVIRDDQTGRVEGARVDLLRSLLDGGSLPVLAPLAAGEQGEPLNVDGDRAAAWLSGELGAAALLLLTGAPGVLERFPDPSSRLPRAHREDLKRLAEMAGGGMKRKVLAAGLALDRGAGRVVISGLAGPEPLRRALGGEGTVVE